MQARHKHKKIAGFGFAAYFMTGLAENRILTHRRAWFLCQEPEPKKHEPPPSKK